MVHCCLCGWVMSFCLIMITRGSGGAPLVLCARCHHVPALLRNPVPFVGDRVTGMSESFVQTELGHHSTRSSPGVELVRSI